MISYFLSFASIQLPGFSVAATNTYSNNVPPRYQWDGNEGYCGEVSLISASLFYGTYISQYDIRAIAGKGKAQNQCQLLVGVNDQYTATQLQLTSIEFNTKTEQNTNQFLVWVKQNVLRGYPVAIGIYMNELIFYGNTISNAGDDEYDHIVPVYSIASNHPLTDTTTYYGDDVIYFSDNGLYGSSHNPRYYFNYTFSSFQASRIQANTRTGPVYSLDNGGDNYGIAITGINDVNGDTVPVRVDTNVNYETPEIRDNSNTRPASMPLVLTVTISHLQPNVPYNLYKYNALAMVPNSQFNAHANQAVQRWPIQITTGSTFTIQDQITSDQIAVYRAVKASAP